jgi:hypothetical protein
MAAPNPEKPEFVLFVSGNCKFSNNFVNKLKSKPDLMKKFNIVDIDRMEVIPDEVEETPFVYDGKSIYQGKPAFQWLNEKMSEFLDAANDGLTYAFLEGQEERVFNGYSLLDQKNGSYGMGSEGPIEGNSRGDPTRMMSMDDNSNKNRTLESIMAARSSESISFNK